MSNHKVKKKKKSCCSILGNTLWFCSAQVKAKFKDDLLAGTEHSEKIVPECYTPHNNMEELSQSDKVEMILNDPKFGMFSLFKYLLNRGYKNEILKKRNSFYCSHTFSLLAGLPILIFFIQWSIYIALINYQVHNYDAGFCPNQAGWEQKLIMFSISLLYFTKSFFLWDTLTDRTRFNYMLPSIDIWVMIDTFQEYGFNLAVYLANIWIVFSNESTIEMIFNSLAMEFLMQIDNEFEEQYFKFLPEVAEDIYDNLFISFENNQTQVEEKKKTCQFRCARCCCFVPFKLLVFLLLIFPMFCLIFAFYGTLCK